jgi:NTP pyrophosphatase (non-canonical NTP hydrolase)
MDITLRYLQKYIKAKDFSPDLKETYFLKLSEEVGELARAMRKKRRMIEDNVKETIEEELWDVIYYVLAIANTYDIDLEEVIPLKEKLNNEKYNTGMSFGEEL